MKCLLFKQKGIVVMRRTIISFFACIISLATIIMSGCSVEQPNLSDLKVNIPPITFAPIAKQYKSNVVSNVITPRNPTREELEFIKRELRKEITPTLLVLAGVDPSRQDAIIEDIKNMCQIDHSGSSDNVVFLVNRVMIAQGLTIYYEGVLGQINSLANSDPIARQYTAIQDGIQLFTRITGFSVSRVESKEQANIIIESLPFNDPRRVVTNGGEVLGHFLSDTRRWGGAGSQDGHEVFIYDLDPLLLDDLSSITDPQLKEKMYNDLQSTSWKYTTAHELGHAFGYNIHSTESGNLMLSGHSEYILMKNAPDEYEVVSSIKDTDNVGAAFRVARLLVETGM
ncbi:MAG: hypothetical protein AAB870_05150 [Patescibacteria group bacterium]